jgi:hypothetical protein
MPGMDHILSKAFLATGGSVAYVQFQCVQQVAAVGVVPAAIQITPTTAGTTGTSQTVIGVVQEPLDATKTVTGKAFVNVAIMGNTKVIWDGTTSAGGTPASVAPALGLYVVPSNTTAGRVRCITPPATYQGIPLLGVVIDLPGSPLPTFGASSAAGDLFDIALADPGSRI